MCKGDDEPKWSLVISRKRKDLSTIDSSPREHKRAIGDLSRVLQIEGRRESSIPIPMEGFRKGFREETWKADYDWGQQR